MREFDSSNSDYLRHALSYEKKLDQFFGIDFDKLESNLSPTEHQLVESYIDSSLDSSALNTSYLDIQNIIMSLPENSKIVDLGAGYGRIGLVNCFLETQIQYEGFEQVGNRIKITSKIFQQFGTKRNVIYARDLVKEPISIDSDTWYFIYLPIGILLKQFLLQFLKSTLISINVIIIESHGDVLPFLNYLFQGNILLQKKIPVAFIRHDPNIHFLKLTKPNMSRIPNQVFWHKYFFEPKSKIYVKRKNGSKDDFILADCELSFYNDEPYLVLPNDQLASFTDRFNCKIIS